MYMQRLTQARDFINVRKYNLPNFLLDFYNNRIINDQFKEELTQNFILEYLENTVYRESVQGKFICLIEDKKEKYKYKFIGIRSLEEIPLLPFHEHRKICIEIDDTREEITFYNNRDFSGENIVEQKTNIENPNFIFGDPQFIPVSSSYLKIIRDMDYPRECSNCDEYTEKILDIIIENSKIFTKRMELTKREISESKNSNK